MSRNFVAEKKEAALGQGEDPVLALGGLHSVNSDPQLNSSL